MVGCGAVLCNNSAPGGANGWYLVCEYDPPGNVIGSFSSNVTAVDGSAGMIGLTAGASGFEGYTIKVMGMLIVAHLLFSSIW